MWEGRFSEASSALLEEFNASIGFDRALWREDIAGSKAHARMLGACGILKPEESEKIVAGLDAVFEEIKSGKFEFKTADEDIHMAVEKRLSEPPYGKVFTAREVQSLPDDTNVVLEGQIVGRAPNGKRDEYIFRDNSGTVQVEIDRRKWRGRTVTPKNTVRLWGEVDYKRSANRVEIDVDHLEVVK